MTEFIDKTTQAEGTPLNREKMMAIQGFQAMRTVFNADGSITETNSDGHTLTTTFSSNGNIVERFVGGRTITKTTTFNANGSITEALS